MPYQVTVNSRNVLVPIALEDRHGQRMMGALAKHDTATAMMIMVSANNAFTQAFFPLKISQGQTQAYAGDEWELWVQKTGAEIYAYYLGIPNSFFALKPNLESARSLSVQVVGTSPMTGREDFSGGLDITLHDQVEPPLIPGFLNLGERFFPTLLPENFIEKNSLEVFEFNGKRQIVLMAALHVDSTDRIPVSLEKHWEAKNWINAVVENLFKEGYCNIRGGCFCSRTRKISHWFGGNIGLEEANFRLAATEKIKSMPASDNGSWVFWLEPSTSGSFDLDQLVKAHVANLGTEGIKSARISIRHPMMHRLLNHHGGLANSSGAELRLGDLPAENAVQALAKVAQILLRHQEALQQARSEPAHALWSNLAGYPQSPLDIFGDGANAKKVDRRKMPRAGLESDIRELYQKHGETLRALESLFDETYGYSAWDAVGNPLREAVIGYLIEAAQESKDLP